MGLLETNRLLRRLSLMLLCAGVLIASPMRARAEKSSLKVIEVKDPDGQILSYRHLAGSTEVHLRGTRREPQARIHLKIGSRPGFVELDINRGAIHGLRPAQQFGKDFLTYVLWAVSVDGKASNLGEITFEGDHPVSINVTTPYQTFWLMLTAEPDFAVVDPSPAVVLYSVGQNGISEAANNKAMPLPGDLFYFTHYLAYDSTPASTTDRTPNQLLQARKAVELASKSGILAERSGHNGAREEEYTRAALKQARDFLARAESAYQKDPKGREVIQFARTAAQTAENARALALGAVGGMRVMELEKEVGELKDELAKLRAEAGKAHRVAVQPQQSASVYSADSAMPRPGPLAAFAKPTLWVAILGWAVALVLLFRRRTF